MTHYQPTTQELATEIVNSLITKNRIPQNPSYGTACILVDEYLEAHPEYYYSDNDIEEAASLLTTMLEDALIG